MRRDALEAADDAYWQSLCLEAAANDGVSPSTRKVAEKRHRAASMRAMALGFAYMPAESLVKDSPTDELLERLRVLEARAGTGQVASEHEADALLGTAKAPSKTKSRISEAFDLYLTKIAFDEQFNKSPKQKYTWEKTKRTSIQYFVDYAGDVYMEDISRDDALGYRSWWMERMVPSENGTILAKPNTANRHIGNMRNLYESFFTHIGQEDRTNPFRKIFFKGETDGGVQPFEDQWVKDKILVPGLFADLRVELRTIIYVLIETGARMSEICNLMPEDIRLAKDVPYIAIRPRQNRELKTPDSKRDIPLVGVALEAMKLCPIGFEHYRDKGELVSANLMKAFRSRDLFPSQNHVIYSFRHSFEKRMLEAGIDYGLRCTLMGHKNDRPAYGDGGSMEYRRDELLKIVHDFPPGFLGN